MGAGRRLADRYEIGEVVAKGGMGVVWRGHDLRLDRPVAVKLVAGEALRDSTVVARFDREARTVARLNHPNIVAIYDFGADGGDSFLVMEFVDGSSLATVIGDGPLPVGETLEIAAQACAGLAAAHAAGVVHRDVKPANLIRTPAGVVKVCDFGIASLQDAAGQARLTGTAIAMGSTNYMAPEQVNGDPVDARTDLYGLGCTIYAMLTGKPPFVGSPLAVVHQHVTAPAPDLRSVRPDVPAGLARLVEELLAKSPDDRPPDAAAVAGRLAGLRSEPVADVGGLAALGSGQAAVVGGLRPDPAAAAGRLAALGPDPAAVVGRPAAPRPDPAVTEASPVGSPNEGGRRKWLWGLVVGGCAALAAIIVASFLATGDEVPAAVTSVTPTAVPTASVAPPPPTPRQTAGPARTTGAPAVPPPTTATPAPTSSPPSRGPTDPVAALRLSIRQQVAAGHLAEAAVPDLDKRVDDLAKRIREGNDRDATKKIKELRTKLADLHREGRLTQAGYDALDHDVDGVAALVPPPPPKPKP